MIVENLTHLCICPVCGAPDCGVEYTLWTESEGCMESIVFGGGSFGSYLNYWYYKGIPLCEYAKLPEFVRHYNEGIGWQDNWSTEIDAYDFLRTLESIRNSDRADQDFEEYYYPVFKKFVDSVMTRNLKLFIDI